MSDINLRYARNMYEICLNFHRLKPVFDHSSNKYGLMSIQSNSCPSYPVWSLTFLSLHLTIPQKYIDWLLWVTTTGSKKAVKGFSGVLLYFPDWHSKKFCLRYPVCSLSRHQPLFDHSANTYMDSFVWMMTIGYHLGPLVTIWCHLVSWRTILYHWIPMGIIGYHWVPSGIIRYHWVPLGTIGYH